MGRLYQCVRKDKGNGRSCVTAVSHALGGPVGLARGSVGRVGRGGLFVHHGGGGQGTSGTDCSVVWPWSYGSGGSGWACWAGCRTGQGGGVSSRMFACASWCDGQGCGLRSGQFGDSYNVGPNCPSRVDISIPAHKTKKKTTTLMSAPLPSGNRIVYCGKARIASASA